MSPLLAFIKTHIADSPDVWSDDGSAIGDGYYRLAHDGSSYAMGSAKYMSAPDEKQVLMGAIEQWRKDTGSGKPKTGDKAENVAEVYIRAAYKTFADEVRRSMRRFTEKPDADILAGEIRSLLVTLDESAKPMEAIERNNSDAGGSGVSGA